MSYPVESDTPLGPIDIPLGPIKIFKGYSFSIPGGGYGNLPSQLELIVSNVIGFLTLIAGLAFIFYFLIGAINWITAGGDNQKSQLARQQIFNALIGLIVVVLAYPIISVLSQLLGIHILNPKEVIKQFQF